MTAIARHDLYSLSDPAMIARADEAAVSVEQKGQTVTMMIVMRISLLLANSVITSLFSVLHWRRPMVGTESVP
jgi:hypothetical protein